MSNIYIGDFKNWLDQMAFQKKQTFCSWMLVLDSYSYFQIIAQKQDFTFQTVSVLIRAQRY